MAKLIDYVYEMAYARSGVGYFSFRPVNEPDLCESLALFAERPCDAFLRDYLLTLIFSLSGAEFAAALATGPIDARGLAAILPELRRRAPDLAALAVKWLPALSPSEPREAAKNPPEPSTSGEESSPTRDPGSNPLADLIARSPALEPTPPPDPRAVFARAVEELTRAGILVGGEMRHEASLSPIALLREWRFDTVVADGRNQHRARGKTFAYGRGLSYAQARTACVMEALERACAYVSVADGKILDRKRDATIRKATVAELAASGEKYYYPYAARESADAPLNWLRGQNADGEEVWTPARAVFLFCNLDEPRVFADSGSTGLASGATDAGARLVGLTEVIERDSGVAEPFNENQCFELRSRDSVVQSLLDDYRRRKIYPRFQDITGETGLPAYRCVVVGADGSVAQATAANLSGAKAAISALTETPWPYSWANPLAAGKPSRPPRPGTPIRFLEALPSYDLGDSVANLKLLEDCLRSLGKTAIYVDISREDLSFPAVRVFVPGARDGS